MRETETDKPELSATHVMLLVTRYSILASIKKWQLQVWVWPLYVGSAGSM